MACSKDLHSIYIDNEMPDDFVSEYENQIKNDSKSAAELEKMKKLHELLNFDAESESAKISDEFMQKSFERLQSKMRYTQTMQIATPEKNVLSFVKYPVSFAAAAAVFAMIFIPAHLKAVANLNEKEISAITHTKFQPIAEAEVKIDGNLEREQFTEFFEKSSTENKKSVEKTVTTSNNIVEQKTVKASAMVSSRSKNFGSKMTSVDVFKPKFEESSISMKMPELGDIPLVENLDESESEIKEEKGN